MLRPILRQTTPPASLPVEISTVWKHLELITEEDDSSPPETVLSDASDEAYVADLVTAAVSRLDGPSGLLNRCLITQDWEFALPRFPFGSIRVPLVRCSDVISVKYVAPDGSPKTLADTEWTAYGLETDHATIAPAAGKRWPATMYDCPEAVLIEVEAGFGSTPDAVPGAIRLAILEMVTSAYEHREDITLGSAMPLPAAASRVVTDWTSWTSLDADNDNAG